MSVRRYLHLPFITNGFCKMNHEIVYQKLEKARITLEIGEYDLKMLSQCPPGVFVCNQLIAGFDEWVLLAIMHRRFSDAQIIFPYPFPEPKGIKPFILKPPKKIPGYKLLPPHFAKRIIKPVKEGIPIGLVVDFSDSLLKIPGKNLTRTEVLQQLQKSKLPIIPVHLVAESPVQHPLLRFTLGQLPFMPGPDPIRISIRVGAPILPADTASFTTHRDWAKFLQANIFALETAFKVDPLLFVPAEIPDEQEPLAEPVPPELVIADMNNLTAAHKVAERGQFDVFVAPFSDIPNAMFEIARLRELTFRKIGEGTGRKRDMDAYDIYYLQLIIWDREKQQIAGGYRLGLGDHIFKKFGVNGFYTNSLFKLKRGFYPTLKETIELGRSYVIPDYQRHRLPLFLLWKGLLKFLTAHPQYRYLYGPVSISKHYSEVSKGVIIEFVRRNYFDHALAQFVKPRKAFKMKNKSVDVTILANHLNGEFEKLEHLVEDIEPWHLQVPVLLRQYLKQNAKFIAFNVDPLFSDCLDGLMLLDVQHLPEGTVEMLK